MSPLRVGLIGVGYAEGTHLPVYAALAEEGLVELVAVATAHRDTAEAAAAQHGIRRAHIGFEALCADPDVDLVDVATRPSLHRPMAEAALAAGRRVLCEAPLATSAEDGAAMTDAAGDRGFVDMQSRFRPGLVELRRLVRDGYVGRVDNIAASAFYPTFTLDGPIASSGWCAQAAHGASSLRVHGLHTADLLRWTFGELTDVHGVAVCREPLWAGRVSADSVDSAAWTARTPDGAVCSVHSSWVARYGAGFRLVVHGSDGMLLAEAAGHTGHSPVRLSGARRGDDGPRELVAAEGTATDPFARLIRCLASGDTADVPRFADGLAALRIADAVEAVGRLTSGR